MLLFAYVAGPSLSLAVENMGDPLQLCAILLGGFCDRFAWAFSKEVFSCRDYPFVLVLCVLIHESSMFLVLPLCFSFWGLAVPCPWACLGIFTFSILLLVDLFFS